MAKLIGAFRVFLNAPKAGRKSVSQFRNLNEFKRSLRHSVFTCLYYHECAVMGSEHDYWFLSCSECTWAFQQMNLIVPHATEVKMQTYEVTGCRPH